MWKGILLALSACFAWGLIFVVPEYMDAFTPLEVVMSRYFFFGILSCALFALSLARGMEMPQWRYWVRAARYSLIVNIFYYIALVMGIRYSDPGVVAMIAGLSPIMIAFYGNWMQKEIDYKSLILPSLFIFIGLVLINIPPMLETDSLYSLEAYLFGLGCAFVALSLWSWFVVSNARFLKREEAPSSYTWCCMLGVTTLVWTTIIAMLHYYMEVDPYFWTMLANFEPGWEVFVIGGSLLGIIATWIAYALWNGASRHLPVSLSGQMMISETVFGVLFVYLYIWDVPSVVELIGITLMLSAIGYSTRLFYKRMRSHASSQNLRR